MLQVKMQEILGPFTALLFDMLEVRRGANLRPSGIPHSIRNMGSDGLFFVNGKINDRNCDTMGFTQVQVLSLRHHRTVECFWNNCRSQWFENCRACTTGLALCLVSTQ